MRRTFKKIIALLLAALTVATMLHTSVAAAPENGDYKLVAITFDDGPGPYTEMLLDGLKERNAKATFFLIGGKVEKYKTTVQRMIAEDHQVGAHTYTHPVLPQLSYSAIISQFTRTADIITSVGGDGHYWVRPPYGSVSANVKRAAADFGVPLINWDTDSLDWKYQNASKDVKKVMSEVKDGSIILFHDVHAASIPAALEVIDILQAQGYEFVTVEELFARRGVTVTNGTVYFSAPNKGVNLGPEVADAQYFDEDKIETHWGYSAMKTCVDSGVLSTDSNGAYNPNKYMTRAEFVEALGRNHGVSTYLYSTNGEQLFTDVPTDASCAPYLKWAVESGIISGDGTGKFNPDAHITRQETTACIERYMKNCKPLSIISGMVNGTGSSASESGTALTYKDAGAISSWAIDSVRYCSENGIFAGATNNMFLPYGKMTRAQAATVLQRLRSR